MSASRAQAAKTRLVRALPHGEPQGAVVTFSSMNLLLAYEFVRLTDSPTGPLVADPFVGSVVFEGVYGVRAYDEYCSDSAVRLPQLREAELVEVVDSNWMVEVASRVTSSERVLLVEAHHFAVRLGEFGLLEVIADRVRFDGIVAGELPLPKALRLSESQLPHGPASTDGEEGE